MGKINRLVTDINNIFDNIEETMTSVEVGGGLLYSYAFLDFEEDSKRTYQSIRQRRVCWKTLFLEASFCQGVLTRCWLTDGYNTESAQSIKIDFDGDKIEVKDAENVQLSPCELSDKLLKLQQIVLHYKNNRDTIHRHLEEQRREKERQKRLKQQAVNKEFQDFFTND